MGSYLKADLDSNPNGFSLIEILIAMGILAPAMPAASSHRPNIWVTTRFTSTVLPI